MKLHRSFVPILTGSDLSRRRLPWLRADSGCSGPTVWLAACAHGDEVGGIAVVTEVFRRLKHRPLLKGTLNAFPLMNPIGFDLCARHVPHSEEDLNRSFPGSSTGSLGERIAARIFEIIIGSNPDLVLDLHNDWTRTIPYAVLDSSPTSAESEAVCRARRDALATARCTGFPVVLETTPIQHTLSHSLLLRGVPALTIELGESRVVNEQNVELGVQAVWNSLTNFGMLESLEGEGIKLAEGAENILRYSSKPLCGHSGIIRFLCQPGQWLAPGETLARVEDVFGRTRERLTIDARCLVLGVADSSVAYPGAPVVALGLI